MYLGNDEILEMYLGDDSISEAYLGEDLVFSTGPFMGLKVIPRSIGFNPYSLSGTTKVKSSEPWQITSNPLWITASPTTGDSGETIVTLVSDELSAATSGSVMFESNSYSASLETSFNIVQFVDAIRANSAPNWDLSKHLDTGIYVTDNIGTTIRVKYIGGGEFSDRIVGFDATETGGNDDTDFRYFPTMADAGSQRIDSLPYSLYESDVEQDITLGNLWVYDNKAQQTIASTLTGGTISDNTTIRVDMSTNWIEEVIISVNNTPVFDGKAAYLNGEYGMYDTVSNTFIHDSNLNIVPRTAPTPPTPTGSTRTLEITDIPTPPSPYDGEDPWTKISIDDHENYAEFGIVYDWSNYQYVISTSIIDAGSEPITGFTTAFTNSALTISGDWGDEVNIYYEFKDSDEYGNCLHVGEDSATTTEYFDDGETAVSSITLTFPSLEVDAECQCGKDGGDWDYDNNICLHDAALIIDGVDIPDDGGTHEYRILNSDGDTVSVLSIDTSDWSYTYTDDPDGTISHGIATVNVDDYGDLSAGGFRWEVTGFLYGEYDIQLDNTSLISSMPDFDGSSVANYISWDANEGAYVINAYSCYDEWNCMANDCGNWNSQTGECDCV